MTGICKVCLKSVMTIFCDHCDNWIHIKCNSLDKLDYQMVKNTADSWFCISCTSNILYFRNRHKKKEKNIYHTYDTNSLNFSNKYRDPEYFCNLQSIFKSKGLSIFYPNICSLIKHFDQLHALLTGLDIDIDFIGITESRISKNNFSPTNIALANYAITQAPTKFNAGGAVLYIHIKHSYKIRKDLQLYKPRKIESVFIELIMTKRTNIIVGCISRHPDNNIDHFSTNYLRPLLQKSSKN